MQKLYVVRVDTLDVDGKWRRQHFLRRTAHLRFMTPQQVWIISSFRHGISICKENDLEPVCLVEVNRFDKDAGLMDYGETRPASPEEIAGKDD